MGTSSGGFWNRSPFRRMMETKRLNNHLFKNVLFSVFTAAILCSIVLCKQQDTRYNYETKRLNYNLRDNAIYQYNNNNHKILRPKRDINGGFKNMKSVHYCTWNAPLNTKYLTPYYEENREIKGCASSEKTTSGVVVHAIHLNTTARNILLTIEDNDNTSSGIILLLFSSTPVNWRLSFDGDSFFSPTNQQRSSYSRNIYISKGSTLKNFQDVPINVHQHNQMDNLFGRNNNALEKRSHQHSEDESIAEIIRNKWGALTTFSRISGANRISILLPQGKSLHQRCLIKQSNSGIETQKMDDTSSDGDASTIMGSVAYMITKQPATGCFHEEVAGTSGTDVHVIDLQSAEEYPINDTKENLHKKSSASSGTSDDDFMPNVYLSLAPERGPNSPDIMHRDLTLILNSKQKVKWYLESIDLSGELKVISTNGPVFDYDLAANQQLSIENNPLPAAFDQLWKAVVTKTNNNPISYSRIDKANVLTIIVPKRPKRTPLSPPINFKDDKATMVPDPKEPYITGPIITNKKSVQQWDVIQKIENELSMFLSKICNQQRTVITLPIDATNGYHVIGVHLNEPDCVGNKNETHWVLTTKSTSCGSYNLFKGSHPIMENNVILQFASGTEYSGLEVRLPVECRFCSGIQDMSSSDYNEEDCDEEEEDLEAQPDLDPDEDEMYEMRLSLAVDPIKENTAYSSRLLLKNRYSPAADVKMGDKIVVSTHFETSKGDVFNLAINKCWLSDHPAADKRTINDENWLLYEGCPSDFNVDGGSENYNNVALLPNPSEGHGPSFTFDITRRHARGMRNVYVKCLMGLCSSIKGFENIAQCVDPSTSCQRRKNATTVSNDHVAPTAQQLVLRGPLRVIQPLTKLHHLNNNPSNRQQQPTEIDLSEKVLSDYTNRNLLPGSDKKDKMKILNEKGKPPMHHSHAVMVGVPLEIAIAVALASFVIGAALTGVLCCVHHKKSTPKSAWRNGDVIDPSTEGSELQSMIASPSLQPQLLHHHSSQQNHHHNGRAIIST